MARLFEKVDKRCAGGGIELLAPAVCAAARAAGRGLVRRGALRRHKASLGQLLQLVSAPGEVAYKVPVEARLLLVVSMHGQNW